MGLSSKTFFRAISGAAGQLSRSTLANRPAAVPVAAISTAFFFSSAANYTVHLNTSATEVFIVGPSIGDSDSDIAARTTHPPAGTSVDIDTGLAPFAYTSTAGLVEIITPKLYDTIELTNQTNAAENGDWVFLSGAWRRPLTQAGVVITLNLRKESDVAGSTAEEVPYISRISPATAINFDDTTSFSGHIFGPGSNAEIGRAFAVTGSGQQTRLIFSSKYSPATNTANDALLFYGKNDTGVWTFTDELDSSFLSSVEADTVLNFCATIKTDKNGAVLVGSYETATSQKLFVDLRSLDPAAETVLQTRVAPPTTPILAYDKATTTLLDFTVNAAGTCLSVLYRSASEYKLDTYRLNPAARQAYLISTKTLAELNSARASGPQPTISLSQNGMTLTVFDLSVRAVYSYAFFNDWVLNSTLSLDSDKTWYAGCVSAAGTRIFLAAEIAISSPPLNIIYAFDWNVNFWQSTSQVPVPSVATLLSSLTVNDDGNLLCFVEEDGPGSRLWFVSFTRPAPEADGELKEENIYSSPVDITNTASLYAEALSYDGAPIAYQWQRQRTTTEAFTDIVGATDSRLNITNPTIVDYESLYRVVVDFGYSTKTVVSNAVRIADGGVNGVIAFSAPEDTSSFFGIDTNSLPGAYCYWSTHNNRAVLSNGSAFIYYEPARELAIFDVRPGGSSSLPPTWNISTAIGDREPYFYAPAVNENFMPTALDEWTVWPSRATAVLPATVSFSPTVECEPATITYAAGLALYGLLGNAALQPPVGATEIEHYPTEEDYYAGTSYYLQPIAADQPVAQRARFNEIVANSVAAAALDTAGNLFFWGDATTGLSGGGDAYLNELFLQPTRVPLSGQNKWAKISMSNTHLLALDVKGELYSCGQGLGLGRAAIDTATLAPVETTERFIAIAAGNGFSLALNTAGYLFGWGNNTSAVLGASASVIGEPTTPVQTNSSLTFTDVACAKEGFFAQAVNEAAGFLFGWGDNRHNQVSGGRALFGNPTTITTPILWLRTAIAKISLGYDHGCALSTDNVLYSWGGNSFGQIGAGTREAVYDGVFSLQDRGVRDVAAGLNFTAIIDAAGAGYSVGIGGAHKWSALSETTPNYSPWLFDPVDTSNASYNKTPWYRVFAGTANLFVGGVDLNT